MTTKELKIQGMHCGHCVMAVKDELSKVPDVKVEDVRIGSARIQMDETKVSGEQISKAVEEAGYKLIAVN